VTKALTVCNEPGCSELVERGKCPACERKRRAARPRHSFYSSPEWKKIRGRYVRLHPVCEEPGCVSASVEVHHVDDDTTNNDDSNLRAVCKSCHGKINLQPFRERDTMKRPRHAAAPRGPAASEAIVGGLGLDRRAPD
jgi:5-methylcytosine-specific restriction protein A